LKIDGGHKIRPIPKKCHPNSEPRDDPSAVPGAGQARRAGLPRVALLIPQTVGVIIRNLQRDGAIRKTPHPVHGKVLQWTLTRRGGTLLEKCRRHAQSLERRLMAGLSANAQVTVRHWRSKIAADLQQDGEFRA
jgi:hypothetical protein